MLRPKIRSAILEAEEEAANRHEQVLNVRFRTLRDAGVERFSPLLLQTVKKYDATSEGSLDDAGKAALDHLSRICADFPQTDPLRQPLPSASPMEFFDTLMLLLDLAL